jgi:hypothetical protein
MVQSPTTSPPQGWTVPQLPPPPSQADTIGVSATDKATTPTSFFVPGMAYSLRPFEPVHK